MKPFPHTLFTRFVGTLALSGVLVMGVGCQKSSNANQTTQNKKKAPVKARQAPQTQAKKRPAAPAIPTKALEAALAKRQSGHKVDVRAAQQAATSNNVFGVSLLRHLVQKNKRKNVFISPYSLSLALSMTMAGAKGQTFQELKQVLAIKGKEKDHHKGIFELSTWLRQDRDKHSYQLNIANRIWVEKTKPAKQGFVDVLRQYYGAGFAHADFVGQFKAERKRINRWIKGQTQDMIPTLLPQGALNKLTRMVLTNAIFFKGSWASKFKKKSTKKRTFYAPGGKTKVQMMWQKGRFSHAYIKGGQVLELPYKGKSTSMVVFLPNKGNKGWQEAWLQPGFLDKSIRKMHKKQANVYLPRMKLKSAYGLKKHLKQMGVRVPFANADFGRMLSGNLKIAEVYHNGALEVNEEGTKAAAATAVVMRTRRGAMRPQLVTFRVNRPFLLLLRERKTNTYLFAGAITKP